MCPKRHLDRFIRFVQLTRVPNKHTDFVRHVQDMARCGLMLLVMLLMNDAVNLLKLNIFLMFLYYIRNWLSYFKYFI